MEELDVLKTHWKNENAFQKIPRNELYQMAHKKSSSIVKWIMIISITEFLFWLILPLISGEDNPNDEGSRVINNLGMETFLNIMSYINYALIIVFCFIFYRNYKKIKLTDGAKNLMNNILKVRKTVMYYINISLSLILFRGIVLMSFYFTKDKEMIALFEKASKSGKLVVMIIVAVIVCLIALSLMAGIVYLYYKIIYGVLLKKLYRNYGDLKKDAL